MDKIIEALGLTFMFTIIAIIVVGGLMWLLYRYFNRYLPKNEEDTQ